MWTNVKRFTFFVLCCALAAALIGAVYVAAILGGVVLVIWGGWQLNRSYQAYLDQQDRGPS